jgi:ATP-dependent RNA helicase DeaD
MNEETGSRASPRVIRSGDLSILSDFSSFGLSSEILKSIEVKGYTAPLPVQVACIGPVLAGDDLLVRSRTGTGKTAAFAIPLLERIDGALGRPQVMVLAPTRELALQVAGEFETLGHHRGVRSVTLYGGVSLGPQTRALAAGAQVVVGTPGRVLDHMRRRNLDVRHITCAVLDEADEMLSRGFYEDVTAILDRLSARRQTLLFSASLPDTIDRMARRYLDEPTRVDLSGDEMVAAQVDNVLYFVDLNFPKERGLLYLLAGGGIASALVFCNTRTDTAFVANYLNRQGIYARSISSDLEQGDREAVMNAIKAGELRFLVATDIAARGIDIQGLTHVINYSLPEGAETYLHRVGRTGRVGRSGQAISMVSGRELSTLTALQRTYGLPFREERFPPIDELLASVEEHQIEALFDAAAHIDADNHMEAARALAHGGRAWMAVGLLLKSFYTAFMEAAEKSGRFEQPRTAAGRESIDAPTADEIEALCEQAGVVAVEGYRSLAERVVRTESGEEIVAFLLKDLLVRERRTTTTAAGGRGGGERRRRRGAGAGEATAQAAATTGAPATEATGEAGATATRAENGERASAQTHERPARGRRREGGEARGDRRGGGGQGRGRGGDAGGGRGGERPARGGGRDRGGDRRGGRGGERPAQGGGAAPGEVREPGTMPSFEVLEVLPDLGPPSDAAGRGAGARQRRGGRRRPTAGGEVTAGTKPEGDATA